MLVQSATSAIVSLVLVKYYSSGHTPGHMLAGVWLSYFLVTLSLALLTTDVYQIGSANAKDLTTWWRFVYWAQFLLSFVILPFLI